MKKYQYIVAAACVLVGAVGFTSMYGTNQSQKKQDDIAKNQQIVEEVEDKEELLNQQNQAKTDTILENEMAELEAEPSVDEEEVASSEEADSDSEAPDSEEVDTPVDAITDEGLHFEPENGLVWPIEGSVLLDYSMDATIYFPTLQQYQYNPAMIIAGDVNSKVYFVAKGKITNIETNEVTGCTVTQDIGDGYTAVYGQLKELNFAVGDMVESGQVVGYVSEPTKYYAVEGSNVYFQLLKDGVPVDPEEILP